jgi:ornithine carbamoyltransferase
LTGAPGTTWEAALWPAHVLASADLTCVALEALLDLAEDLRRDPAAYDGALAGETVACLIAPPTAGAVLPAAVAAQRLGMVPVQLPGEDLQLHDGEPIGDAARAVAATAAALLTHAFSHPMVKAIAAGASVPVINALSDLHRPCQALADLITLRERFGRLSGLILAFVGDGATPVAHSLLEAGALAGMQLRVASPPGDRPDPLIAFAAGVVAELHGGRLTISDDPEEAVAGAHAVYTTAWVPPGREEEREARVARLRPYRVVPRLMSLADREAVFMHCLPAHRGQEVSAHVIDGPRSVVDTQAANSVRAEQALLYALVRADRPSARGGEENLRADGRARR